MYHNFLLKHLQIFWAVLWLSVNQDGWIIPGEWCLKNPGLRLAVKSAAHSSKFTNQTDKFIHLLLLLLDFFSTMLLMDVKAEFNFLSSNTFLKYLFFFKYKDPQDIFLRCGDPSFSPVMIRPHYSPNSQIFFKINVYISESCTNYLHYWGAWSYTGIFQTWFAQHTAVKWALISPDETGKLVPYCFGIVSWLSFKNIHVKVKKIGPNDTIIWGRINFFLHS